MRVLICGGRDFIDVAYLFAWLDNHHEREPVSSVIHGGAIGADYLAYRWAEKRNIPTRAFFADWNKHGRAAGPIRNQQMLDEGKPELVIAFPGGRGTADMIRRAKAAGVRVVEV